MKADRPAELVNAWTADTKNSTRRDWRWVKLDNDYVEFWVTYKFRVFLLIFELN